MTLRCAASKYTAEMVFFLFKIAESILDPTVRLYIYHSVCQMRYGDFKSVCANLGDHPAMEDLVQADSAHFIMAFKILLNLPVIVLGLFCGAWSDRIGRKIPVMLPCLGTIFATLFCMASRLSTDSSMIYLVLAAAFLRGLFGKSAVVTMALHSYISDISPSEERTKRLGRLLAMNFFGYFVGSMVTGLFIEVFTYDILFVFVIVLNAMCVFITICLMEESIPTPVVTPACTPSLPLPPLKLDKVVEGLEEETDENEVLPKKKSRCQNPFHPKHIRESLDVLVKKRENNDRLHIVTLFVIIIIQQACKSGEVDITLLVVEKAPLSWSKDMYVYLLATDYICLGFAVFIVLPIVSRYVSDSTLVAVGFLFKAARLLFLAFSHHTWLIYMSVIIGCPSAMIISGAKSLISKSVDEREVGKAFSLLSCCETLSNLIGSVVFTVSYTLTLNIFPGTTFTIIAGLCFALACLTVILGGDIRKRLQYELLRSDTSQSYGTQQQ